MAAPKVVFSPREAPPFPVDAIVEEEDTFLSLSAPSVLSMPGEHPVRVMTAARETEEIDPGSVVAHAGHPLKLLAVIHRLSEDPTWRESWTVTAIGKIAHQIGRRRLRALATPLLGTVHGRMSPRRSLELLAPLLAEEAGLHRLWIVRASAPPPR